LAQLGAFTAVSQLDWEGPAASETSNIDKIAPNVSQVLFRIVSEAAERERGEESCAERGKNRHIPFNQVTYLDA
jgi:hypothetical protein